MTSILKLDLDLETYDEVLNILSERLKFLQDINILKLEYIEKIDTIKKTKYSVKIYLTKTIKDEKDLIIMQSILGSDYKHIAITFRDYSLKIKNYNRLFDMKRYPNGEFKTAQIQDITEDVMKYINNK